MGILDKLQPLKDLIRLDLNNVTLGLINTKKEIHFHGPVNQQINLSELNAQEKRELQQLLLEAFSQDIVIAEDEAGNKITLLQNYSLDEQDDEQMEFVLEHLPQGDVVIWRAALFLRYEYQKKQSVTHLKQDIILRFGDRGRNITNLCTAGYLEAYIIPLQKMMEEIPGHLPEKFEQAYDLIVEESPFAVFVSNSMSVDAVRQQVGEKIERNRQYGLDFVAVHGIGAENVKKILKVITEVTELLNLQPEIYQAPGNIRVVFRFTGEVR